MLIPGHLYTEFMSQASPMILIVWQNLFLSPVPLGLLWERIKWSGECESKVSGWEATAMLAEACGRAGHGPLLFLWGSSWPFLATE